MKRRLAVPTPSNVVQMEVRAFIVVLDRFLTVNRLSPPVNRVSNIPCLPLSLTHNFAQIMLSFGSSKTFQQQRTRPVKIFHSELCGRSPIVIKVEITALRCHYIGLARGFFVFA